MIAPASSLTPRSPLPKTIAPLLFRSPLRGFNPRSHSKIDNRTGFGLVRSHKRVGFVVGFGGWNAPDKMGDRTAPKLQRVVATSYLNATCFNRVWLHRFLIPLVI